VLEPWQQRIVDRHTGEFIRGLIHSGGCRTTNRFTTRLPSGRVAEYAYGRYFFSNLSTDIRGLFCHACDLLGVRWTQSNPRNISVSPEERGQLIRGARGPRRRCRGGARSSSIHWTRASPCRSDTRWAAARSRGRANDWLGPVAAYGDGLRRQRPSRGKSAQPPSRAVSSPGRACGRSVVAAQKPSKLLGRVRFPSPASQATGSGAVW
jgi:hypothetical protein